MRVIFDREPERELPSLFAPAESPGQDWMRAAHEWVLAQELTITRWRVDQKFMAGGQWRAIVWRADLGRFGTWEIQTC